METVQKACLLCSVCHLLKGVWVACLEDVVKLFNIFRSTVLFGKCFKVSLLVVLALSWCFE